MKYNFEWAKEAGFGVAVIVLTFAFSLVATWDAEEVLADPRAYGLALLAGSARVAIAASLNFLRPGA